MDKEILEPNSKECCPIQDGAGIRGFKKFKRRLEGEPVTINGSPQEVRDEGVLNMDEDSGLLRQSSAKTSGNPWGGKSFIEAVNNKDSDEPFYTGSDDEDEDAAMEEQGNALMEGEQLPNLSKFLAITSSREDWVRMTKPWRRSIIIKVEMLIMQ